VVTEEGIGRGPGDVTPVAEYNIWVDPDAAKIVFESGLPIKMVGWDPAHAHACMDDLEIDRLHRHPAGRVLCRHPEDTP
jgi:purine nucleosidase